MAIQRHFAAEPLKDEVRHLVPETPNGPEEPGGDRMSRTPMKWPNDEIRIRIEAVRDHDRTSDWLRRVLAEARIELAKRNDLPA
jgi:hypothetical protein